MIGSYTATAQNYNYIIKHYYSEKGLSGTIITDIEQGSNGIIWLSTSNKIYKYDGYKFYEFQLNHQVNYINKIFPENERFVWILSINNPERLILFDIIKKEQIPISELFPGMPFSTTEVINLLYTGDHECWITTKRRIFTYNSSTGFSLKAVAPDNLVFDHVEFVDNSGNFWVKIYENQRDSSRLYYNETSLYFLKNGEQKAKIIYDKFVFAKNICISNNTTWVLGQSYNSTQSITQLYKGTQIDSSVFFEPKFSRLALIETKGKESTDKQILYISDNLAWLLLKGERLYLIDFEKGVQLDLTKEIKQFNKIYSLNLTDRDGNLWMTTEKGLVQIILEEASFEKILYANQEKNTGKISTREIIEFNNSLWVCSYSGFFHLNNNYDPVKVGQFNYGIIGSDNGYMYPFMEGNNKSVIYEMDPYTYKTRAIHPNIEMRSTFRCIYEDRTGTIWLGDIREGLFYIPSKRDKIYMYENKKLQDALHGNLINQIIEHEGFLWLATSAGLFKIDLIKGHFIQYNTTSGDKTHIPVNNITFIHVDKNKADVFWLATNEGIIKLNISTKKYRQITKQNGLSDNYIHSVYEDNNNNLWVSSNHGLMCINKNSFSIRLYFEKDGITDDEFNFGSSWQADDGKLYFGGLNGITAFYPDSILNKKSWANEHIQIISCRILNFDHKVPKTISVEELHKNGLKLAANNVSFSLSFSMLNFQNPEYNYYQYKITGLTNDWIDIGHENSITLSIPGGVYQLHLRGKTNNKWTKEIIIPIISKEFFYKTKWFYIVCLIIIITIIYVIFKVRITKIRENNIRLENEVKNRTKQINEALAEKDILFKELHHRVKNNLTILKSLLYLQSKNTDIQEVKSILKECENRIHAMAMVHEDLFGRENRTIISLKPFSKYLLTQLVESFNPPHQIDIKVSCEDIKIGADKCILLSFVINELVTNSCKYAFKNTGDAVIGITIREKNHTIEVTYYDNGCGLSEGMDINRSGGFGFKLILMMMEQLDTSIHYKRKDNFCIFEFSFVS